MKRSDDLEIYEIDSCSKEQLEELCDIRQPVLLKYYDENIFNTCKKENLLENYGAFDIKVRNVHMKPTGENELYMPLRLNDVITTIKNDEESKYLTENNSEFLEETGLNKIYKSSDIFLRPANVAQCDYDICMGGEGVCSPLRYDINYRKYYLVTEGEMDIMLTPPRSGKYLFQDLDYENLEFRSPINPWNVQEQYKRDFDKVKCLELTVRKGDILYIPAYGWHSMKYKKDTVIPVIKYTTYMNMLAILPELSMKLLQNQNIKRIIAPKLVVTSKEK